MLDHRGANIARLKSLSCGKTENQDIDCKMSRYSDN